MKKIKKIVIATVFVCMSLSILFTYVTTSKIKADQESAGTVSSSISPSAGSLENDKITGAMTKTTYQSKFSTLNVTQNDAWNKKYNFRPETNVKSVGTWADFRAAFQDNTVSKIILTANITYNTAIGLNRTESLELDGNNYTLTMTNGSLNFDTLRSLDVFTKNFSDVPVFHMHDISIINNSSVGALEGNLSTAWSFINGNGEWGPGAGYGVQRGLWRYRVGNVTTPFDSSRPTSNQRVGGRLIGGNRAQISMWGYNQIVTGAENFYAGGIDIDPHTYYRGEIAAYNYSTIWFIDNTLKASDPNSTGSRKFEVGQGSFVYLHNTNTGTGYPAIYEFFDEINVGESATFNANVAGSAISFNVDNAKFIAQNNSTVNLLSRSTNSPTIALGSSNSTNGGTNSTPNNISVAFNKDSNVNIVGNNSRNNSGYSGIIGYYAPGRNSSNATVTIDNPDSFDITNLAAAGALGFNTGSTFNFNVNSSDISLWKTATATTAAPDLTYPNVETFTINSNSNAAKATSSNSGLQNTFVRNQYRRINGLNSVPEIQWDYVTTADYSQKAKVLLGQVAAGGSNPFDPNGDAIMNNVYADANRIAQIAFTDTLGNTYTGYSGSDNYVTWTKENHKIPGFQIGNDDVTGIASKIDNGNDQMIPYRTADESSTKVLLVSPPDSIQLTKGKITDVDSELTASGIQENANVYIQVNDGAIQTAGKADASGNWHFDLANKYKIGDKVRIYLENTSELPADFNTVGLENTRIGNSNRNPINKTTYRDAEFAPATVYVVEKGVITQATVAKSFSSDTDKIGVGSTLTFTINVSNDEIAGSGINWKDVNLTDIVDEGLDYDPATADVKVNGTSVSNATYEKVSRKLTVPLGTILPKMASGENIATITFKAKVNRTNLLTTISNTAKATGKDDVGSTFEKESNTVTTDVILDTSLTINFVDLDDNQLHAPIVIEAPVGTAIDLNKNSDVQKVINDLITSNHQLIKSPDMTTITISGKGDTATYTFDGVLKITSTPQTIDFGSLKVSSDVQTVDNPTIDNDLTVLDTRSSKTTGWVLSAKVTKSMTNDTTNMIMPNALKYNNNNGENSIMLSESDSIIENGTKKGSVNISSEWGETDKSNGVKLIYNPASMSTGNTLGDYVGTIQWTLSEVPKL